jgi:hypothetical protein
MIMRNYRLKLVLLSLGVALGYGSALARAFGGYGHGYGRAFHTPSSHETCARTAERPQQKTAPSTP